MKSGMKKVLTIVLAGLMIITSAEAAVVMSDSFDRGPLGSGDGNGNPAGVTPKSDWGSNDNAFGGTAVQTYTFDQSRGGGAQQTLDGNGTAHMYAGAAQVEVDLAPLAAGGMIIEFDFLRTSGNGFICIAAGLDDTDQIENTGGYNGNAFLFTNAANGVDAAALFKQNGDIELWDDTATATASAGFYSTPEAWTTAKIILTAVDGYDAGDAGLMTLQIGAATTSINFNWDGISSGYLSLYSNQTGAQIDNLVVSEIPEPATMVLLGLGGILMRRRK